VSHKKVHPQGYITLNLPQRHVQISHDFAQPVQRVALSVGNDLKANSDSEDFCCSCATCPWQQFVGLVDGVI